MTAAQFQTLEPAPADELLRARFEALAEWGIALADALRDRACGQRRRGRGGRAAPSGLPVRPRASDPRMTSAVRPPARRLSAVTDGSAHSITSPSRPSSGSGSCGSMRSSASTSELGDGGRLDPVAVGRDDVPRRVLASRSARSRPRRRRCSRRTARARRDRACGTSSASRDRRSAPAAATRCSSFETLRKTFTIVVPSSTSIRSHSTMWPGRRFQTFSGASSSIRTATTSS